MIPMGLFAEVELAYRRQGLPNPVLRELRVHRSGRGRRRTASSTPRRWRQGRTVAAG